MSDFLDGVLYDIRARPFMLGNTTPEYYVIMAAVKGYEAQVGVIAARNAREAMDFSIDHYRKTHNLKTSVTVRTKKLYESPDPEVADQYFHGLMRMIEGDESSDPEEDISAEA